MNHFFVTTMFATSAITTLDTGHSGVAHARTAPEMSDVALFVVAAVAVWLTRRALRARHRKD